MAICQGCGKELLEGSHFCPDCCTITDSNLSLAVITEPSPPEKHSRFAVVNSWSFMGTMLLMSIPIVGLILTLVWAMGGANNLNRVHFARGVLLLYVLMAACFVGLLAMTGFTPDALYSLILG